MPSNNNKAALVEQVVEVRYERGYRYLDRCGDVMVVLEDLLNAETGKTWMTQETSPSGAKIKCPELDILIFFDSSRLGILQAPIDEEYNIAKLSLTVLALIVGRLDLRSFSRFGMRRVHLQPADSIEDAAKLLIKHCPFKPNDWPLSDPSHEAIDCEAACVRENPERNGGYRVAISAAMRADAPEKIDERLLVPPKLLPTGQRQALLDQMRRRQQRSKSPVAGMQVDIDFYHVRPERVAFEPFLTSIPPLEHRILSSIFQAQDQS